MPRPHPHHATPPPGRTHPPRRCDNRHMSASTDNAGSTHFGFRDVPVAEKQKLVAEVFTSVAG